MSMKLSSIFRGGVAAGALALLTGCAAVGDSVVITRQTTGGAYSPKLLTAAQKYDSVKLDVSGIAFGEPLVPYAEAVLASVQRASTTSQINWTLEDPDPRAAPKLIVLTNPPFDTRPGDVCAGERPDEVAGNGQIQIMMVYCIGQRRMVSKLWATRAGVNGIADPGFDDLIRQAAVRLFPSRDETRGDGADFEA
jgi:hypothetical protein